MLLQSYGRHFAESMQDKVGPSLFSVCRRWAEKTHYKMPVARDGKRSHIEVCLAVYVDAVQPWKVIGRMAGQDLAQYAERACESVYECIRTISAEAREAMSRDYSNANLSDYSAHNHMIQEVVQRIVYVSSIEILSDDEVRMFATLMKIRGLRRESSDKGSLAFKTYEFMNQRFVSLGIDYTIELGHS